MLQAEREARESIRIEQDAAYQESLEADRRKVRHMALLSSLMYEAVYT